MDDARPVCSPLRTMSIPPLLWVGGLPVILSQHNKNQTLKKRGKKEVGRKEKKTATRQTVCVA